MADKKIPTTFNVQVYGNLEYYSPTISKARVRIFYRGLNRNYSYITEEFAEKLIQSLPYAPVKGIYDDEDEDFTSHGMVKSLGKAYGVVPENGNGQWERHIDNDGVERTYYCTDVLLWTSLYENAKKIPGKCQSMELYEPSIKGEWKEVGDSYAFEFAEGNFLGLQVLGTVDGEKVEPCFEGSAFYSSLDSEQKELIEQFSEIIKVAKNYNLQKEEKQMEDANIQTVETVEETTQITETQESVTENNETVENTEVTETVETTETAEPAPVPTENALDTPAAEPTVESAPVETNEYEEKFNQVSAENAELKEKFSKLSDEFSVLKDEFEHLKAERDTLKEFKEATENAEKKQILEKYSAVLNEETLKKYTETLSSYSALDLDKELCFEAHKNDSLEPQTTNFSYKNNDGAEESELFSLLSNYKTN